MTTALQRLRACDPRVLPFSGVLLTDPEACMVAEALASADRRAQTEARDWCHERLRCHRRAAAARSTDLAPAGASTKGRR